MQLLRDGQDRPAPTEYILGNINSILRVNRREHDRFYRVGRNVGANIIAAISLACVANRFLRSRISKKKKKVFLWKWTLERAWHCVNNRRSRSRTDTMVSGRTLGGNKEKKNPPSWRCFSRWRRKSRRHGVTERERYFDAARLIRCRYRVICTTACS